VPRLDRYKEMRDFEATPEPAGADAPEARPHEDRFVIQQHDATRLHWDLRLERDGVLASWALPRGLPWSPKQNHLAVHTEDHPLEYLTFHGDIPEGEYGAGNMFVWDTGTYETEKFDDDKVTVVLHGERAEGRFALFQTRGRDWIIHRMDPPADPTRQPLPDHLALMGAVPGPLPTGKGWAFEVRWTGCRALLTSSGGVVAISDAAGNDVSASFPEVRRIGRAIGYPEVILDGVIVSGDRDEKWIAKRLSVTSDSAIRRQARDHPLAFVAFDLVWFDGHSLIDHPWTERRAALDDLALDGPAWQAPKAHVGDGAALLAAARDNGLPGLVAKRTSSHYEPGKAPGTWVRVDT
jgi:bifunctional non-homologous end joining protein LigD